MNEQDSHRHRLAAVDWPVPAYAQNVLRVESPRECVAVQGADGVFTFKHMPDAVTVRWCGEDGPALARLDWQAGDLGWRGATYVGGYVDAVHVTEVTMVNYPVAVIYLGGHPLKSTTVGYPGPEMRGKVPYPAPDFYAGLAADVPESLTMWLVADESPLANIARDALLKNLRLHFFGQLADERSGWGDHFALPLLLHAVTLFGP